MKNKTIIRLTRNEISKGLQLCTEDERAKFRRIFPWSIDEIPVKHLENALDIIERTIKNR